MNRNPPVHPISWSIMKTTRMFAIAGVVCALVSLSLGFAGKAVPAGLFGLAAGLWCIATAVMGGRE